MKVIHEFRKSALCMNDTLKEKVCHNYRESKNHGRFELTEGKTLKDLVMRAAGYT